MKNYRFGEFLDKQLQDSSNIYYNSREKWNWKLRKNFIEVGVFHELAKNCKRDSKNRNSIRMTNGLLMKTQKKN